MPQSKEPTANTRIRLFGIVLSDRCRDDLGPLVDKRISNQGDYNAHAYDKNATYQKLGLLLGNSEIHVSNPPG